MTDYAAVPPQVQSGTFTLNVDVRALGAGRASVSLLKPGQRRALLTEHTEDDEVKILVTITGMVRKLQPQLEAAHRAEMAARGYRV